MESLMRGIESAPAIEIAMSSIAAIFTICSFRSLQLFPLQQILPEKFLILYVAALRHGQIAGELQMTFSNAIKKTLDRLHSMGII
jgi:hypothetical protein